MNHTNYLQFKDLFLIMVLCKKKEEAHFDKWYISCHVVSFDPVILDIFCCKYEKYEVCAWGLVCLSV